MPGLLPNPESVPRRGWMLILVVMATLANYIATTDLLLFADDYIAWSKVLSTMDKPWWHLFAYNYNPEFYRPFEHILIRMNADLLGTNPVIYRWATVIGHLLTVLSVYWFSRRLNFGFNTSLSASLIFGISHANAMAVLSNDAACQIYCTLFGMLAMGMMVRRNHDLPISAFESRISAVFLLISLFWKDSGISYAPAIAYLILRETRLTVKANALLRIIRLSLPYLLIFALYFTMRFKAGVTGPSLGGPGRYGLWFGLNIPENIILFLVGMLTPVGSSIIVLRLSDPLFLAVWISALAVTCGIFLIGLVRRWKNGARDQSRLLVLIILMFSVMMPTIFMNRVSELYVYQPNALFAVLLAASLTYLYDFLIQKKRRIQFLLLSGFCIMLVFSHSYSVNHKAQRMRDNGLLTKRLTEEIKAQMPKLASRKILAVNRSPGPAPLYSIYFMEGVYVLGGGKVFEYLYGEKLEEFRYYNFEDLDRGLREIPGKKLIVLYRRDHVILAVAEGEENPFSSMPP